MSSYLWITQYLGGDEDLREIARMEHDSAAYVASEFGRLARIFGPAEGLRLGEIYIERVIDDELLDGSLLVPLGQVQWLLLAFFRLPNSTMLRVRKRVPSAAASVR